MTDYYWDSNGIIHSKREYDGKSSTTLETMAQISKPIGDFFALSVVPPMLGSRGSKYLLGKTAEVICKRNTRPGIALIEQNSTDHIIDSILDNRTVFDDKLDKNEKERLLKDALALSQDIYVINNHSSNFYHTDSFNTKKRGWFLINHKLRLDGFPREIREFCNEVNTFSSNFNNIKSGLGSAVFFINFSDGMYIISYVSEGTNLNGFQDIGADFEQGFKAITPQYSQSIYNAKLIVAAYNRHLRSKGKLFFFGHSLGGGLANVDALATGFPAITFNASSLHPDYVSQYQVNLSKHLLTGIYVEGEILSTNISKRIGLPKVGDRYKVQITGMNYNTPDLHGLMFKIAPIRKHMLEPLCSKYGLPKTQWNKLNEL